jgi:hypothetical protein
MFAIIFYVFIISIVGFTSMLFLAHTIDIHAYLNFLSFIYNDPQANTIAGFIVAATMFISFIFARFIYGRQERERNIFINNPLGRVTISVSAIEDLIRNMAVRNPQIKEIKPDITSGKRSLNVDIKLILRSATNIPDLTEDLQDTVKRKIQEVIGGEERINIRVHVIKIASDVLRATSGGQRDYDDEDAGEASVPFHGYKA